MAAKPGSPCENVYLESLNGKVRDELLNGEIFDTLMEAQVWVERGRNHYSQVLPDSFAIHGIHILEATDCASASSAWAKPSAGTRITPEKRRDSPPR